MANLSISSQDDSGQGPAFSGSAKVPASSKTSSSTCSGAGIKVRTDPTGKTGTRLLRRPLCEAAHWWQLEELAPAVEAPTYGSIQKSEHNEQKYVVN